MVHGCCRMLRGAAGRHLSIRRRGSSPLVTPQAGLMGPGGMVRRRRAAVTTSDHKTCALIHTRLKLGDIM